MKSNVEKIEKHIEAIMDILELPRTESNKDTPKRVAKLFDAELFVNRNNQNIEKLNEKMKLFPNLYDGEMIIVKDIECNTMCEHHWLPFTGKVTVAYIPGETVIGLSKIPRVVKYFSKKPQLQEQITEEIGNYLYSLLKPIALFVEMESVHECVKCRGAESNCSTKTFFKRGTKEQLDMYYRLRK